MSDEGRKFYIDIETYGGPYLSSNPCGEPSSVREVLDDWGGKIIKSKNQSKAQEAFDALNSPKPRHNWVFESDKIFIRGPWANRLKCSSCPSVCFVHRASDGEYYCDSCANELVRNGEAILGP